jgi:heterodisulfide reductase subunit A
MTERTEQNKTIEEQELSSHTSPEKPRIGVYICECGGNIGDTVNCEKVAQALAGLPDVTVSRVYQFMCSDPGQKLIIDDIKEKGVNRVVVGACSIFLHEQTFRRAVERAGLNPYLYTHVGLREQDSWVHHDCVKEATEKAFRLMSTGIAKARLTRSLDPVRLEADKHVLVIGGGVAGLRSALSIARRGLPVTLVEKSNVLGGQTAQWDHLFPTEEDALTLVQNLVTEVLREPNITIYTGTEVVAANGYVGNFDIRVRVQLRGVEEEFKGSHLAIDISQVETPIEISSGLSQRKAMHRPYENYHPPIPASDKKSRILSESSMEYAQDGGIRLEQKATDIDLKVGAVVLATGFRPYEPFQGELGYAEFPEVITLPQMERLLSSTRQESGDLKWNGHKVSSLAMIHCVGSRQIEGIHKPQQDGKVNDYCSRVCCTATLSAANQVRERYPHVTVYDVYQDIRTYGRGHEDYYTRASKNGVTFLRYFGEEIPEVVQAEIGAEHPLLVKVRDHLTWGEEIELPVDLVVLSVGMMPGPVEGLAKMLKVARGSDRFLLEVHPKLRPVETAVAGVVLAGTAQAPMNIQESCAAAEAAAAKVAVLLGQGKVELEPYVAAVNPDRCEGAGECVRVCPQEDAIHIESVNVNGKTLQRALITSANCNGCGVCVSACPNQAIDVQGWRLEEFQAMVDAIAAEAPALEEVV